MKIGVCIPSRGLVHTRTIESLVKNFDDVDVGWKLFFTHDLPIPDAHNAVMQKGMDWGADYIWMIEEDIIVPSGSLKKMLETGEPVYFINYPVGDRQSSCMMRYKDRVVWTGTGCLLMKREVLEKIPQPWMENKTVAFSGSNKFNYVINKLEVEYGGQDVHFGHKIRSAGFEIKVLDGVVAGHIRIEKMGGKHSNSDYHKIHIVTDILQWRDYK